MHLLFLTLFLVSSFSYADSWQNKVQALLPAPVSEFTIGKATLKNVTDKMGKAHLIEGEKHYWKRDGFKYALVLTFKKNLLTTIHYTFTSNRPTLESVKDKVKMGQFSPYNSKYLMLKEGSSELVIDPASKTIYSVRLP